MTDATQAAPGQPGKLFLYEQPELLTPQDHGELGMTPSEKPYAFAADVRAVPVTLPEFWNAHRDYPIVFTNVETPFPVAVLGVLEDRNLFMQDGRWDAACYIPAYLRCHPFAFAAEQDGRIAVAVDRAAATVSEESQYPFFVDGKLSREAEQLMRFCARYEAERKRTVEFCRQLKVLGLLAPQQATHTPADGGAEQTIANYVSIDADKLAKLGDSAVLDLHKSGCLAAAYLQVYSMENWQRLMERRDSRPPTAS